MRPPLSVLAAYGADPAAATPLRGGRGRSWRVEDLVLKPADAGPDALAWLDTTLRPRIATAEIRVSLPVRARDGALQVDGWTAFPYLPGRHVPGRWREIAEVGATFARLTAGLRRPAFLDRRRDPWAVADRFAWAEEEPPALRDEPTVAALLDRRRPVAERPTLMHGDLTGNVLFQPDQPPALIDLSLYYRPARYGTAVVGVDAVCFQGAPPELLGILDGAPDADQYLLRALLFRMATDLLTGNTDLTAYTPVVRAVLAG